jgi:two-component system nitrogen regulation sensor histidine kinase NtrY
MMLRCLISKKIRSVFCWLIFLVFITSFSSLIYLSFYEGTITREESLFLVIDDKLSVANNYGKANQESLIKGDLTFLEDNNAIYVTSIFKNNHLVYWNENKFPSIKFLHHRLSGIYLDVLKEGKFLIVVSRQGNLTMQQFIPLGLNRLFSSFYFENDAVNDVGYEDFDFQIVNFVTPIKTVNGFVDISTLEGGVKEPFMVVVLFIISVFSFLFVVIFLFVQYGRNESNINRLLLKHTGCVLFLAFFYTFIHIYLDNNFRDFALFNPCVFYLGSAVSSFAELFLFAFFISISQYSLLKLIRFCLNKVKIRSVRFCLQWSFFYLLLYFIWGLVFHINTNSTWIYDISESLFFSPFKLLFFVMMMFVSYWVYGLLSVFDNKVFPSGVFPLIGFGLLVISFLVLSSYMLMGVLGFGFLVIIVGHCKYFKGKMPLVIISIFLSALLVSSAIVSYRVVKLSDEVDKFASSVLSFRDIKTEFLLFNAGRSMQADNLVLDALSGTMIKKRLVNQKIQRVYLKDLSLKYKTELLYFDHNGNREGGKSNLCFEDYVVSLDGVENLTDFSSVFLKENLKNNYSLEYYTLLPIYRNEKINGYLILISKEIKHNADHIVQRLKYGKAYERYQSSAGFDFSIVRKGELLFSKGGNTKDFLNIHGSSVFYDTIVFQSAVINDVQVLVRSRYSWLTSLITNFSFYLILFGIVVFLKEVFFGVFSYFLGNDYSLAYRIKALVLVTLVVPLALLSLIIYTNIDNTYQEELRSRYSKELERLIPYIGQYAKQYKDKLIAREELEDEFFLLANQSGIQFNYFDSEGFLIFTANEEVYKQGLLATLINPNVFQELRMEPDVFQESVQQIGDYQFSSIYGVINGGADSSGIVSIPYYNADSLLNSKRSQFLTSFLVAFIGLFLVFYLLSEKLVLSVTRPLIMISEKLRSVVLSGTNKPLEYKSRDEIGLLVKEYNKMIVSLDASKVALSHSEKESAWREMAKQVAHEIKNPLTPMKLMLQHLKYRLGNNDNEEIMGMSKSMGSLITHIDSLGDIASSFAVFAKMPFPVNVRFLVNQSIEEQVLLFSEDKHVHVNYFKADQNFYIKFDPKLLSRIIMNILVNAKQSKESGRLVSIEVKVIERLGNVLISVADNGQGIANELKDKVFIPNFTTKGSGSGIGLAVAKRGVEQGGGEIWFKTFVDVGTTFFIQFPIVK